MILLSCNFNTLRGRGDLRVARPFTSKSKIPADGAAGLAVKICEAEVFSGLLLLLWGYYAQKPIVFALSPLRLEQACASLPPHAAAGCVSPLAGNSLEGGYVGGPVHSFSK